MTFDIQENSSYDGEPIDLYSFNRDTTYWRYTSADEDKTIGGFVYTTIPTASNNFTRTQNSAKNPINIKMSLNTEFVRQFIASPPSDIIQVLIQRYHETDSLKELVVLWSGRVVNVRFLEKEAEISCEPIYTSIKRPLLRRQYQVPCPYVVYGNSCKVLSSDFDVDGTISNISGLDISASAWGSFADDYFTGGYVEWKSSPGASIDKRFIISHTGSTLGINLQIPGLEVGTIMTAYPGCDHSLTTCKDKFFNNLNNGGFPYMPGKNPMNGTSIF